MTTWTALTTLAHGKSAKALGDAMENLIPEPTGVGVFEIEDGSGLWEVGGYFIEPPDQAGLALLATIHGAKEFTISELPETDWVAHVRRELAPVEAGRFFVYGSHDAQNVPQDKIGLLIEAAMAFGTGHHGTTLGCLHALEHLANAGFVGKKVVDIGCGTAVLAMAAASIWPGTIYAGDIDQVAVDVAIANATVNQLQDRIICVEAAGFGAPELIDAAPFDLVFANILKGPLLGLAPDMAKNIQTGGYAILSGILNNQADEIIAAYDAHGFDLIQHGEIGDWSSLTLQKRP